MARNLLFILSKSFTEKRDRNSTERSGGNTLVWQAAMVNFVASGGALTPFF